MKNQDFNFIKDKFDSAQPELPESLSRDRLRQRILAGAEPKIVPFPRRKSTGLPRWQLWLALCFCAARWWLRVPAICSLGSGWWILQTTMMCMR